MMGRPSDNERKLAFYVVVMQEDPNQSNHQEAQIKLGMM
jgi:hypothetical protein